MSFTVLLTHDAARDVEASLQTYRYHVRLLCLKWLNRRGQRSSLSVAEYDRMLERYPLARPRIYVHLYPRFRKEDHAGSRMR